MIALRCRSVTARFQLRVLRLQGQQVHARSQSSTSKSAKDGAVKTAIADASSTAKQRVGPLRRVAEAYGQAQRKRPYTTQVVGAFVIYFLADLSAQRIGGREHDAKRTGRTLLIGLVAAIPHYKWFMFLSTNFNYSSKSLSIATKVIINQLCFTPIFNTYFFGAQALLSGESIKTMGQRLLDTVPTSCVNALKVWPATVAVSMAFLPVEFRPIFSGVVAIGWQTYLSYLNKQAELLEDARRLVPEMTTTAGEAPVAVVQGRTTARGH